MSGVRVVNGMVVGADWSHIGVGRGFSEMSKRKAGHGRVLPGNSRARNRSRSRARRAWKAPNRLQFLWTLVCDGVDRQRGEA